MVGQTHGGRFCRRLDVQHRKRMRRRFLGLSSVASACLTLLSSPILSTSTTASASFFDGESEPGIFERHVTDVTAAGYSFPTKRAYSKPLRGNSGDADPYSSLKDQSVRDVSQYRWDASQPPRKPHGMQDVRPLNELTPPSVARTSVEIPGVSAPPDEHLREPPRPSAPPEELEPPRKPMSDHVVPPKFDVVSKPSPAIVEPEDPLSSLRSYARSDAVGADVENTIRQSIQAMMLPQVSVPSSKAVTVESSAVSAASQPVWNVSYDPYTPVSYLPVRQYDVSNHTPPFTTILLWGGSVIFIVVGGGVLLMALRKRKRCSSPGVSPPACQPCPTAHAVVPSYHTQCLRTVPQLPYYPYSQHAIPSEMRPRLPEPVRQRPPRSQFEIIGFVPLADS